MRIVKSSLVVFVGIAMAGGMWSCSASDGKFGARELAEVLDGACDSGCVCTETSCTCPDAGDSGDDGGDDAGTDGGDYDASSDPCTQLTTCDTCASPDSTCGWCADDGTCRSGIGAGPSSGSCGSWNWDLSQCPGDPCGSRSSCGDCAAVDGCGWCGDTGTCTAGNSDGPSAGSCGSWSWYSDACYPDAGGSDGGSSDGGVDAGDTCNAFPICGGCTQQTNCGYCATDGMCRRGSDVGPDEGSCAAWKWQTSECGSDDGGVNLDPCAVLTSCGQCTSAQCGWCADSARCMSGSFFGPSSGTCSPGGWTVSTGSCTIDAGTDSGVDPDAGVNHDAGVGLDAGGFDAGVGHDAGVGLDAGVGIDAGGLDAGGNIDAGVNRDAGVRFDAGGLTGDEVLGFFGVE